MTGAFVPGEPDNVRRIGFPRSAANRHGRIEIRYEIIEDDVTVWLLGVRRVS